MHTGSSSSLHCLTYERRMMTDRTMQHHRYRHPALRLADVAPLAPLAPDVHRHYTLRRLDLCLCCLLFAVVRAFFYLFSVAYLPTICLGSPHASGSGRSVGRRS